MMMITQSACEHEVNEMEGCAFDKKDQESSCNKLKKKKVLSKGIFLKTISWFDIA